jgi:hypothetical protein
MKEALQNFWENLSNPVTGSEGVRQILLLLMMFGLVNLTPERQLMAISSVSAVLSLFTRNSTVSTKRVEQKVGELVAHREMAGTTGTGDGLAPSKVQTISGTKGM